MYSTIAVVLGIRLNV